MSGVGRAPDRRDRDSEFAARGGRTRSELAAELKAAVENACGTLESVAVARLSERITVQHYDVTVMEAIYHVVEHFSGHTGQILFATKALTSDDLGFHRHLRTTAAHTEQTP